MGNVQSLKTKAEIQRLDDALEKIIHLFKINRDWKKNVKDIKEILEKKDEQQNSLAHQIMDQDLPKYSILLGFCYMFEINTSKAVELAFKIWENDDTFYGHYLIGKCYKEGWGVSNINNE